MIKRLRQLHLGPAAAPAVAGAGVLAALLPGPALASAVVLMLVVLGLILVDSLLATEPSNLLLERVVAPSTTIDVQTPVEIVVRNPTSRRVRLRLHDGVGLSQQREPRDHRVVIGAVGRASLHATLTPSRRGDLPLGPVTIRIEGPLRLGAKQSSVDLPATLRVYPRLPGRKEVELRLSGRLTLLPGVRRTRILGGGTEFDSLRDHHPDDDHRRINWMATSRAGKPIATVLREERNQVVILMVDAGRSMAGTVAGIPRMELALDGAVAVAEMAARSGDHVGAYAFDRRIIAQLPPRSGRRQGARVLDTLFAVEPSLDSSGYSKAFARVLSANRRRSLLVLLTDIPDSAAVDGLAAALPLLVKRHVVVVGTIRDPALQEAIDADPVDSDAAHRAAAAAALISSRRRAARRLTGLGARVVEATPDRLAGALVDAYLDIKNAGRL